jgi:hypothetical protein
MKNEVFVADDTFEKTDIRSGIFEASDDASALLLMETSMD